MASSNRPFHDIWTVLEPFKASCTPEFFCSTLLAIAAEHASNVGKKHGIEYEMIEQLDAAWLRIMLVIKPLPKDKDKSVIPAKP